MKHRLSEIWAGRCNKSTITYIIFFSYFIYCKQVSAIVQCLLGPSRANSIEIFAGDVIPRKKPDPVG